MITERFHIHAWSTEIHDSSKSAQISAKNWGRNGHLVDDIKPLDDGSDRYYFVYRNVPGYWNGQQVKDGKLVTH